MRSGTDRIAILPGIYKYVRVTGGDEVRFTDQVNDIFHIELIPPDRRPLSAGYFIYTQDGRITTEGESVGLKLQPAKKDAGILLRAIQGGQACVKNSR